MMNTVDMNAKRVGSFAPLPYQMHHLEQANSPPFVHANGLRNGMGFGTPGSPMGMHGMSPASSSSAFSSPPPPGHMAVHSPQSSAGGKSDPPKRLRYWLIDMIESGQIPGLEWEDENTKTVFRIPWKHAGKNNWKEDDCKIFKAWAEHRGKYKEGVDKFDPATWKTRLRCALNKLPDIKELKDKSQLEGTNPFRVYRLLPEPDRNQEFEIYPRSTWGRETYSPIGLQDKRQMRYSEESVYGQPPRQYQDPYQRPGDHAMEAISSHNQIIGGHSGLMSMAKYPLRDDPSQEFSRMRVKDAGHFANAYENSKMTVVPPPEDDQELEFQDHSIRPRLSAEGPAVGHHDQHHGHHHSELHRTTSNGSSHQRPQQNRGLPIDTSPALINPVASPVGSESGNGPTMVPEPVSLQPPSQMLSHSDVTPSKHEFTVFVRYRGTTVMTQQVTNEHGCRIHYGNSGLQHIATVAHELPSHVFGPQDLHQIELCDVEPWATFEKQINLTNHLLKNVQRGLILQVLGDGTIIAKRLCQSRVFFMSPESTPNEPQKLERGMPTKVFDYMKFFQQLKRFAADQCNPHSVAKKPSVEIKISFGQTWSMKNPLDKNLISLIIEPSAAEFLLQKVCQRREEPSINNSLLNSGPTSADKLADQVTRDSEDYVDELINTLLKQEGGLDGIKGPDQRYYQQDVEMEVQHPY